MPCELHIQTPDNQIRRVTLEADGYTIGRAHTNDLCYPEDASLSRKHLRVERDEQGWSVTDLGSKNGTLLNGTRITARQHLNPGDRLSAGQLTISYYDPDQKRTESVVFVPGSPPDLNPQATVMTSLEGLLSSEPTAKVVVPRPDDQRAFDLPVVRALIRAGRELSGHQPLEELFRLILDLSIETVGAERGVLMTLEGDRLVEQAVHGDGFRISAMVRDRVLQEKTSLLVRNIQHEEALRQQLSISEQQIHSLMAVPLQTEQQVIGLIYLDSRLFVREFTPDDLNLLTVLANVAAIRIDHERHLQLQQEEQQAADIQRRLLPTEMPTVPHLDLYGHNAPCRNVGGDYYDFIGYPDGRLAVVVGDVAGKGMSAALLMSSLQARVQVLTEEPAGLAVMMARLDRSIAAKCPSNRFITLFLCVIDPESGETVYCNAGHNPAFIVRASGDVQMLEAMGTVLGILPELGYEEQCEQLDPGDLIAIYSDGVTEASNSSDEEFGEQRLSEVLVRTREQSAEQIVEAVNHAVDEWTSFSAADDDITLVVVRRVE